MECFHTPRYQPNHIGTENNSQGSSLPIVNPNEGKEYPPRIISAEILDELQRLSLEPSYIPV